jgi:small-conductance mechanosensitive channel
MPDLKWMQLEVMNNTMAVWLTAAAVLIGGLLVVLLAHRFVLRPILRRFARAREAAAVDKAAATEASAPETTQAPQIGISAGAALSATVSNALDKFERKMRFFLVSLVIYLSFQIPGWGEKLEPVVNGLVSVLLVLASVSLLLGVYQYVMSRMMAAREEDAARVHALRTVNFLVRLAVWVLALVLILDNFGVNVSTLLAGLGIGGIAIALAAQPVLGALFSGLGSFFDAFELGDFISVASTWVPWRKSASRHPASAHRRRADCPANTDLTSAASGTSSGCSAAVVFTVGVAYETPTEKLRQIPGWIAEIISAQETATFDRAHFVTYGDSALQYEIVFFIETSEYLVYMDIRQQVNLDIKEKFESEGIDFAYPTRTVFVKSMP